MQELEPPEAPLDIIPEDLPKGQQMAPKKEGFFKRLFSKKVDTEDSSSTFQNTPSIELPPMDVPMSAEMPPLDLNIDMSSQQNVTPLIDMHLEDLKSENISGTLDNIPEAVEEKISKKQSKILKSKGKLKKGAKRTIEKIDEKSQFDWSREITDQDILIHDSNRYNQDVNSLISETDKHIDDKGLMTGDDNLSSQHNQILPVLEPINMHDLDVPTVESLKDIKNVKIDISRQSQLPVVEDKIHQEFAKVSLSHDKLRKKLEKYMGDTNMFKMKRQDLLALFKEYDDSLEKFIEDKELSIDHKNKMLKEHEDRLQSHEKTFRDLEKYLRGLDEKLKDREQNINKIISGSVESELKRRLKAEKKALSEGLKNTVQLNADLKKKVKIIEDDKVRFEREHAKMSETERKKLNSLQSLYEKKLTELTDDRKVLESDRNTLVNDRKNFEQKKKDSLKLLAKADAVAKELADTEKMKAYIDERAPTIEKELVDDMELKDAIAKAEDALIKEKANLDNMIFSKYIDRKLKGIRPEYLEKKQDWKVALHSNPLYAKIHECRKLLSKKDVEGAKNAYNDIRKEYSVLQISRREKEALYTAIRELYNDIQLKMIDMQAQE